MSSECRDVCDVCGRTTEHRECKPFNFLAGAHSESSERVYGLNKFGFDMADIRFIDVCPACTRFLESEIKWFLENHINDFINAMNGKSLDPPDTFEKLSSDWKDTRREIEDRIKLLKK